MARVLDQFVCIHGHFYQPPRENPWTGKIDRQPTAEPFHDWNERVCAECYEPNTRSVILGPNGKAEQVVNNYAHMSFNFGPTLLRWLQEGSPDTYKKILRADRLSRKRFGGHGAAIAQAYHHSILPLANRRDKVTEVHWGIRDFEARFRRKPEGMWLPETAANLETLEILADEGFSFTILSPYQAARVRKPGSTSWVEIARGTVDSRRPYLVQLPSGKSLFVFFYNGEIARGVAFQGLLSNGAGFASRFGESLDETYSPQLAHIATDGESYGHHHKFGDMALAYALRAIEASPSLSLTVYGEFLEKVPNPWQAEILENSSWSCAHGVERWRSDCGCQTGAPEGWNQKWRTPLREGLNSLRDAAAALFELEGRKWLKDPWAARDDYIEVLLSSSAAVRRRFLSKWARKSRLTADEKMQIFGLLESQRYALMMFTSCGWFFNDISGIETIQILSYAARLIELCRELFDIDLEPGFLERLDEAKSNDPDQGTGRKIYQHLRSTICNS